MNAPDHLCANLKSRNVVVCVCVCVVLERTLGFFFPTGHQIKTSYSSCSFFYHFLYLAFNNILYFSAFICSFGFLIITFSFSFSSVLSVIKFRCSFLLMCLFLQLFTYSFSTVCVSVIFFYYMFVYLFICLEVLESTTEKCIRIFNHLLIFSLNATLFPHVKYFPNNQQLILAT